jgi:hypothetical protein
MNNSHYPSIELCKKLTEIGFPRTEMWMLDFLYERPNQWDIFEYDFSLDCEDHEWTTYKCPSIAELLDELPKSIWEVHSKELTIEYIWWDAFVEYTDSRYRLERKVWTLPNALAEMYIWLKENNYL